jgi:cell division protein FtsB
MAKRPVEQTEQTKRTERIERIRSGLRIRPRYLILFFILTFFVLGGVYLSQQTKLTSIADEKVQLQAKLDARKVEEERLERMLEYMRTTDYMIQYAREKLGYVFEDDFKFYDDTQQVKVTPKMAETPTPVPALTTPAPTPSPTPAPLPTTPSGVTVVTMAP